MITVIGGAGFIGTRLCQRLLRSDTKFRIVDRQMSSAFPGETIQADIRSLDGLQRAFKGSDALIVLAAEHRDNVKPTSLYDDVNVTGARNMCRAACDAEISTIIYTSTVAVYGFAPPNTGEDGPMGYFNDYGRSKFEAEQVFKEWQTEKPSERTLVIVRPTVVFGERNRGNVYNLMRLIASSKFVMIGDGKNKKSMAYVENVAAFLEFSLGFGSGVHLYNYVDRPDLDMNELVGLVRRKIGHDSKAIYRMPYWLGMLGGTCLDMVAGLLGRSLPISKIRIRKFCSTTQFSTSIDQTGFNPPVDMIDALHRTIDYEFIQDNDDETVFFTE